MTDVPKNNPEKMIIINSKSVNKYEQNYSNAGKQFT